MNSTTHAPDHDRDDAAQPADELPAGQRLPDLAAFGEAVRIATLQMRAVADQFAAGADWMARHRDVTVDIGAYQVSLLPRGHVRHRDYVLTVEPADDVDGGVGRWVVRRGGRYLDHDGRWSPEQLQPAGAAPPPRRRHLFDDAPTALAHARAAAPHVEHAGVTAADAYARHRDRTTRPAQALRAAGRRP